MSIRNLKIANSKPKPVAVINFMCPDCKKTYALTVDKKTVKQMLTEIKSGGNRIPAGSAVAQIRKTGK